MGYKFSNEFRREAVELYESGLSAAAVFDRLEAAHGVRPSRATLTLWVAAHRHGVDQDLVDDAERVRECAAEVIGRVVASRVVLGGNDFESRRGIRVRHNRCESVGRQFRPKNAVGSVCVVQ